MPSSPKNLLTIGDCNTFPDHLLPASDQLAVQIQRRLEEKYDTPVQLTNIGQGMYTTREGLARLKDTPVIPDFVALNFGLVDAWVTSMPRLYISYYPLTWWRKQPLKWLKILKKRLRYLKKIIPRGNVVPEAEYIRNINEIITLCQARNHDVKITVWATPYTHDRKERNEHIARYNAHLKKIAEERNCAFCDSNEAFDYTDKENYLDIVHLSAKGAKNLGEAITKLF